MVKIEVNGAKSSIQVRGNGRDILSEGAIVIAELAKCFAEASEDFLNDFKGIVQDDGFWEAILNDANVEVQEVPKEVSDVE